MFFSQSNSIRSKRQQFHTEIRKKQLDDYRRRKRQQLFGVGSSNPNTQQKNSHYEKQLMKVFSEQFKEKINFSPYPFNQRFSQFFLAEFGQKLEANRYSLESINQVLSILVKSDISELSNFDSYPSDLLFSVTKILSKIMTKIQQIPHNSVLKLQKHHLIQQIYQKVFFSVKAILKGIISQQNYQKTALHKRQKLRQISEKIKNKKFNPSKQIDQQKLQQNLRQLQQNYKPLKHPLEYCNSELKQILAKFFNMYSDSEYQLTQNYSIQKQQQTLKCLDYLTTLWYLASYLSSGLFAEEFFAFYLEQITHFKDFKVQIVDIFLETLTNFLLLQTFEDQKKISPDFDQIRHSSNLIEMSFRMFESCLEQFQVSSTSLIAVTKALAHGLFSRRKAMTKMILHSKIFRLLLGILKKQQQTILQVSKMHQLKTISHEVFIEQVEKVYLRWNQKYQIYQLFGMLFSAIEDLTDVQPIRQHLPTFASLIFYQFNKILIPQLKSKSLQQAVEIQSIQDRQRVTFSVLFLLSNLFSLSPQIIQFFMEHNIISYIIGLWKYFTHLENNLSQQHSQLYNIQKLKQIMKVKLVIINIIWNMVSQFSYSSNNKKEGLKQCIEEKNTQIHSQKDRIQALTILVEYKQCGAIKMLLQYLKTTVYHTESVNIDKEAVKYALLSLERFLSFIAFAEMGYLLVQKFQEPSLNVSTFKQVLSNIMYSDSVYEQQITKLALQCLDSFEYIMQSYGYVEGHEYEMERRYYELEANQSQHVYYSQHEVNSNERDVEI